MIQAAFIRIWGQIVGAVAWNEDEQLASFEYDPGFFKWGWDLAPIHMPISAGRQIYRFPELRKDRGHPFDTFKGLPGLLADVLPDQYGHRLMEVWLTRQGRPSGSMNPVEKLCFIGTRGVGALEFDPAIPHERKTSYPVEMDDLVLLSRQMLEKREGFLEDLSTDEERTMVNILKIGTSAGGARPKAVIAYNEVTGQVRSGQAKAPRGFDHWLIKLDGVDDVQLGDTLGYGRVEMAYHLMARDCGIDMMESRLLEENGRAHFMTRRFDRIGGQEKCHVQSWCAMGHYDFNEVGMYSYEQLFQTMRALGLSYPEAEQMFRRMVFNVCARNCDDHTKNFSFLLKKGGEWKLAPAYDLCYAYRPDSYWVSQHSISINGKRKNFTVEDLLSVAQSMHIKKARQTITEISATVAHWTKYAKDVGVAPSKIKAIDAHLIVDW